MKRYLPFIIVLGVGLATFGSGAMLYRTKHSQLQAIPEDKALPANGGSESMHVRGNPKAPVTLEEFGDYQCPPCGKMAEPVNQLEKDFRPNLRLTFYNFPLPNHQHARKAAYAAEAADLQGKFWEMHDLIYKEQGNWSKAADAQPLFESYAGMLGLDLDRFKKDMQSEVVKERVEADHRRGSSIGVQNTPTLFLNNKAIPPAELAPDKLHAAVAEAVKTGGNKPPGSPTPRK